MKSYLTRNEKPIELGRPSNVGSLIGAVLVGVLALVSSHYARVSSSVIQKFMAEVRIIQTAHVTLNKPPGADTDGNDSRLPPLNTPQRIDKSLQALDGTVDSLFSEWRSKHITPSPKHAAFRELERVHQAIQTNSALSTQLSTGSRLTLLSVTFMASQLAPQRFADHFVRWSESLCQSTESVERAWAEGLRIYANHDLKRPDVDGLLQDLEQFTVTHADYGISAKVYCMISQELALRGQIDASETILENGLHVLDGKTERNLLIRELLTQKQFLPSLGVK